MDRPVDPIFRKKQIIKRFAFTFLGSAIVLAVLGYVPRWIRPSISRSDIRTAIVDTGPIEATISATGTVVPEFEQVLSSPLDARVVKILKKPGAMLAKGEPILDLDVSDSVLGLERLNQQLSLKENEQIQRKLELENKLIDLKSRLQLKEIEVKSFGIQLARQQKLRGAGLNTEEDLRQAQVEEEKAKVELRQLQEAIGNEERATAAKLDGLTLEIETLRKEQAQSRKELDLATTKASRDGVLTWVVEEEGSAVRKGEIVARIADLSSFRVQANISDIHASRLSIGMPVKVQVNEETALDGAISNVLPTIKDGIVTLIVGLEDKSNKLLRSNLRVDVFIVTDRKQKAFRVKRGSFANGEGLHDVFVIRGEKAIRTPVRIGLLSFDECEIVDGLLPGDEVILSDMKDYMHLKEVKLN
jgi:HlyD family secretion protein